MYSFILILMMAASSHALEPVTVTIDSVSSTGTVQGIAISSSAATDIIVSTRPLYRQVCVQNLDDGAYLACAERSTVVTTKTSDLVGVIVSTAPITSIPNPMPCFEVVAGNRFYCRSSNTAASSRAVIHRKR